MLRVVGAVATGALFTLYPVAVWVALSRFSARTVGLLLLALAVPALALRFRKARRDDLVALLRVPLLVLALLLGAAVFDEQRCVLALPVLTSAALLVTFASSLRPGATPLVERFARLHHDGAPLSPGRVAHCRQVTWVWVLFFVLNGTVAGFLALFGSVFVWAAYTGGIAYALMGLLFAGEMAVRWVRFRGEPVS